MTSPAVPEPGWTTDASVEKWHDGDTVYVLVTRRLRLRLLDNWQEELRDKDPQRRAEALAALAFAEQLAPPGTRLRVHVPGGPSELELSDSESLGRALARAWRLDDDGKPEGVDLSARITAQHGATARPRPKTKKPRRPKGGAATP